MAIQYPPAVKAPHIRSMSAHLPLLGLRVSFWLVTGINTAHFETESAAPTKYRQNFTLSSAPRGRRMPVVALGWHILELEGTTGHISFLQDVALLIGSCARLRQMELSCPKCGLLHDVPEKAFLVWKRPCGTCGVPLTVVAVERPSGNEVSYLAFELREADSPAQPPFASPPASDAQP